MYSSLSNHVFGAKPLLKPGLNLNCCSNNGHLWDSSFIIHYVKLMLWHNSGPKGEFWPGNNINLGGVNLDVNYSWPGISCRA